MGWGKDSKQEALAIVLVRKDGDKTNVVVIGMEEGQTITRTQSYSEVVIDDLWSMRTRERPTTNLRSLHFLGELGGQELKAGMI